MEEHGGLAPGDDGRQAMPDILLTLGVTCPRREVYLVTASAFQEAGE